MPRDDVKEMPFIPFSISRFIICYYEHYCYEQAITGQAKSVWLVI